MDLSHIERAVNERSLESIEGRIAVSTVLVVVGLIIEYWFPLYELIQEIRKRPPFPWKKLMEMTGGVLVIVGVAGELGFQFRASYLQTRIRSDNQAIESLLVESTEKAVASAEKAVAGEKEAAQKLIEAEYRLSPWNLDVVQLERMAAKLKVFPRTPYTLSADSHPYALDLAEKLDRMLQGFAGWEATLPVPALPFIRFRRTSNGTFITNVDFAGVRIEIPPPGTLATYRPYVPPETGLLDFRTPGIRLAEALKAEGIPASIVFLEHKPNEELTGGSVHVIVGRKL